MDIPVELLFFLILIVANAIAGLFKGQKKKGPTGTSLPPAKPQRPRSARTSTAGSTRDGRVSARDRQAESGAAGSSPTAGAHRPWWEAEPEPSAAAGAARDTSESSAANLPWWELPDEPAADEPGGGGAAVDPWRDDPDRPAGPVTKDPEDLWAILTGETLSRPAPPPMPEPTPPLPAPYEQAESRAPRLAPTGDDLSGDDLVVSLEGESLEATEISSEARHEAFHEKIGRRAPATRRIPALDRIGLADPSDVRRAVVMAEVLGRPRSMSGPDW
ncbi:MAG TPA: hypothetical protein VK837_02580 [Longimicrobiales bacterium]|nr:hypothetical protein [Longimicrobiales bacterium]